MSMNKVQFQAGLSMFEFFDLYGTQEKCEAVVRQWRWPQGAYFSDRGRPFQSDRGR